MKRNPAEQAARNELENAIAHGAGDREKAARKRLAALGVDVEVAGKARRAAAGEGEDEKARRTPPQGRATPAKAQTRA